MLGEDDPKPNYDAKDTVPVFMAGRAEIAEVWRASSSSREFPCPIPWDVCDLGFIEPYARPVRSLEKELVTVEDHMVMVRLTGVCKQVKTVSDLSMLPWSTKLKMSWALYVDAGRRIFEQFKTLVRNGEVQLYERIGGIPRDGVPVLFDTPIPANEGEALLGAQSREVDTGGALRTVAKSIPCTCAPPWTRKFAICPTWWPRHCYHGARLTVDAYYDGTLAPEWDDLGGGSDHVTEVGMTPGGLRIFSYIVDLYDRTNSAIWIDEGMAWMQEGVRVSNCVVVGSNGHSGYMDRTMHTNASKLLRPTIFTIYDINVMRFPKFESSRRASASTQNNKCESEGLAWFSRACKMTVPSAIRSLALSPFRLELNSMGNCFFALFRECNSARGRVIGPISANMALQTDLFADYDLRLRTRTCGSWVKCAGAHMERTEDEQLATARHEMRGWFGEKPDMRAEIRELARLEGVSLQAKKDSGFGVSFLEPGQENCGDSIATALITANCQG